MTARWGAPAPEGIRHVVRAPHHPARAVPCPHCLAHAHAPCTTISKRRRLAADITAVIVHSGRIAAWAREVAVCPACQVEPGVECHGVDQTPLPSGRVHPQREVEAGVTA